MAQNTVIEQIKDRADAIDVIGRVVKLRKSGRSWSGLCPFHSETDGSFHVYDDGHYHCFGCGANGDVITFYEQYYHLDFKDACERLGREFGIEIDWGKAGGKAQDQRRDALYRINAEAANHYYKAIKRAGNPGLAYLLGRGIGADTIKAFGLGYADEGGRSFAQAIQGDKQKLRDAEEAGLLYPQGGGWRDRYRSRVMFPIVNPRGKVIGFGGRDLTGDPKAGKYINSKESQAFSKGYNLYALHKAQTAIREKGFAILVEGYMDAVALHMHGVTNAVAQLGTAFTPHQAKLLSRYTKNVVLALDSDASGRKAAEESGAILRAAKDDLMAMPFMRRPPEESGETASEAGMKVKVLVLSGAKDPDEYIRAYGRDAFDAAVRQAVPLTEYRLARLRDGFDTGHADGLADYLKAASVLLGGLEPVEREAYIKKIAQDTGVAEEAVRAQAARSQGVDMPDVPARGLRQAGAKANAAEISRLLEEMLAYPLNAPEFLPKVTAYRHLFSESVYAPVLEAMNAAGFDKSGGIDLARLRELPEEEDMVLFETVFLRAREPGSWSEKTFGELVRKVEIKVLEKRSAEMMELLAEGAEEAETADFTKELDELQRKIKTLEGEIRSGPGSIYNNKPDEGAVKRGERIGA
ncbi:MAG: DNA primase [Clostridiales Family XIII bacterium]|nr:DNA primase [Clostridiales Family XIII bacterium]